jgi:hypothetical protein
VDGFQKVKQIKRRGLRERAFGGPSYIRLFIAAASEPQTFHAAPRKISRIFLLIGGFLRQISMNNNKSLARSESLIIGRLGKLALTATFRPTITVL